MGRRSRILVVDDEESIRGILNDALTQIGADVSEASSAEDALRLLETASFDLIMTDIRMPGLSGIDLLERVKKARLDTEVIIMTSDASLDSSLKAIRLGAYDYLLKPFEDLQTIEIVVQRAIDKHSLKRENQTLLEDLKEKNEELVKATQRAAQILAQNRGFYEMGRDILESQNREELGERLTEALFKFSKEPCLLWFYAPEARALVLQNAIGVGEALIPSIQLPKEVNSAEGAADWLSKKRYRLELAQALQLLHPSALIDLPLVIQRAPVGLLVLLNRRAGDLAAHEASFLEHLALLSAAVFHRWGVPASSISPAAESSETAQLLGRWILVRDPLTSFYSFDYFIECLSLEVARSRRYRHKFTLFLATILPSVNPDDDPKAHSLFRELAESFQKRIRATDLAARCGSKFFVLLPETDQEGAHKVFRALTEQIEEFTAERKSKGAYPAFEGRLVSVEYPKEADSVEGLITILETTLAS